MVNIAEKYITEGSRPCVVKEMGRRGLYGLFAELGFTKGAEVGVQRGRNAMALFEEIPGLHLIAVDPYKNHKFGRGSWPEDFLTKVRKQTHNRLRKNDVTYIELFSEDAVRTVDDESLDFVYIDGDHSYDFCMLDILLWSRKVRKGGIISGHDFSGHVGGVKAAALDYSKANKKVLYATDGKRQDAEKGDLFASWFWVK